MATSNSTGVDRPTDLNPLIATDAEGTTSNVRAVLAALASTLEAVEPDEVNPLSLGSTEAFGMALILRTCDQALRHSANA